MPDIVLATLNAKYLHTAFGLRCLFANLGELRPRAGLFEFDLTQHPLDVVEALLAARPKVIALAVYVWNVTVLTRIVATLKRIRPEVVVVLGGPEVSHESESQEIVQLADHTITGEADLAFADLCRQVLAGMTPAAKVIHAPLPDLARLASPYEEYSDQDIGHRTLYVEASRGCPFTCEFCLSSLDVAVRAFPLATFLESMGRLLERGALQFKFVDRTFNLDIPTARSILQFFLDRLRPGLFLHFEMVPDRLPDPLRSLIRQFPPGSLQFEVGLQTLNPDVAARIRRRQDYDRLRDNLRFLREETGVHVHADLIAGLPGESWESFAAGFDALVALRPQEIQLGILKRLRGAPIVRHDAEWGMVYSQDPPYEILCNRALDFDAVQRLRRFARFWNLVVNSGNFVAAAPLIWEGSPSVFGAFCRWSEWIFRETGCKHGIALDRLAGLLARYLEECGLPATRVRQAITADYSRAGRRPPATLASPSVQPAPSRRGWSNGVPPRQRRHLEP